VDAGILSVKAGDGGGLNRVIDGNEVRHRWCYRRRMERRLWWGDTAECSNLELEGSGGIPCLLSSGLGGGGVGDQIVANDRSDNGWVDAVGRGVAGVGHQWWSMNGR
jgi:hypothetical protein